ncbi:MAG: hypothetical protein GTN62_02670 [Gemmatimonadales bacterium]|nr:hypothetical protein [Gemmatimonadales bacterium]NIP06466.1 hypothetical protein [Gemmatimonadales bacterium]
MEDVQVGRVATLELDATCPQPFSYLSGVRELPDGKILAADPMSQVLLRLDLDAGTADTLGRHGEGPQEYQGPDQVFPLPGDSTLLVDLGNGRLTVIDPEGTFVDWSPMSRPTNDGRARTVHPRFVDAAGNLYATAPYSPQGPPDTTAVHRIDRASGEETPVAWSWRTEYVRRPPGAKRPMFVPYDDWAVGTDGRVAVVRANGFSVDWYFPDGRVVQGPPNELETFPLGQPEMEAEVEAMSANAVTVMTVVGEGGTESLQMSRGLQPGTAPGIDDLAFPETLPIFRVGGTLISPRGEVWVERLMPAGGPARVEIFDERGIRLGFIELPARSKVIAFGEGAEAGSIAYLARTDDVGLIWLERYRIRRARE